MGNPVYLKYNVRKCSFGVTFIKTKKCKAKNFSTDQKANP